MRKVIEGIGWYGVVAILSAYALLSFDAISSKTVTYQLLNLTGSVAIFIEAFSKKDYEPVVINLVWAIIAIISLGLLFL